MLSNVLKKLLCSFKILQLSFLYTHFPKKQVNSLRKSYIYIYIYVYLNLIAKESQVKEDLEDYNHTQIRCITSVFSLFAYYLLKW